jgi:hypothetical protein
MVVAYFKPYLKNLVGGTEDIHEKSGPRIVSETVIIEKKKNSERKCEGRNVLFDVAVTYCNKLPRTIRMRHKSYDYAH